MNALIFWAQLLVWNCPSVILGLEDASREFLFGDHQSFFPRIDSIIVFEEFDRVSESRQGSFPRKEGLVDRNRLIP